MTAIYFPSDRLIFLVLYRITVPPGVTHTCFVSSVNVIREHNSSELFVPHRIRQRLALEADYRGLSYSSTDTFIQPSGMRHIRE